ncbi:MAG: flagellar hook-basal body complex protein FliE [Macromonas bipunctata]|jgi:flagellar hook-basal body complex protein FliE|uniref:flagellar hook-basal body complex protein FliE n=1 Tax=Macromonas bipunctata TaxID=183670 RepID=UPI000C3461E8|nr:flagellar hook-basal body complex protein FliE [Macromonas bipunctata]MDD2535801.1 flagellar hook-basal body complex protein FliE [Macromonas bipunctata]
MDLRLTALTPTASLDALRASKPAVAGPQGGGAREGFSDAFKSALHNVSALQKNSNELQDQVQLGNPNVSLEQTMLAMQKSQIGFQTALHVRNRMVQAYTDIMNMQV